MNDKNLNFGMLILDKEKYNSEFLPTIRESSSEKLCIVAKAMLDQLSRFSKFNDRACQYFGDEPDEFGEQIWKLKVDKAARILSDVIKNDLKQNDRFDFSFLYLLYSSSLFLNEYWFIGEPIHLDDELINDIKLNEILTYGEEKRFINLMQALSLDGELWYYSLEFKEINLPKKDNVERMDYLIDRKILKKYLDLLQTSQVIILVNDD